MSIPIHEKKIRRFLRVGNLLNKRNTCRSLDGIHTILQSREGGLDEDDRSEDEEIIDNRKGLRLMKEYWLLESSRS